MVRATQQRSSKGSVAISSQTRKNHHRGLRGHEGNTKEKRLQKTANDTKPEVNKFKQTIRRSFPQPSSPAKNPATSSVFPSVFFVLSVVSSPRQQSNGGIATFRSRPRKNHHRGLRGHEGNTKEKRLQKTANDTKPEVNKFKQTIRRSFPQPSSPAKNPATSSVFPSVFFVLSVVKSPRQQSNGGVAAIRSQTRKKHHRGLRGHEGNTKEKRLQKTANDTKPEVNKFKQTIRRSFPQPSSPAKNPATSSVFPSVFFVLSVVKSPRQQSNGGVAAISSRPRKNHHRGRRGHGGSTKEKQLQKTENDTNPEVHKFKQTQAVRFSGTITCPNPTPSSVFLSVFFVFSVVAFPRQRSNGDVAAIRSQTRKKHHRGHRGHEGNTKGKQLQKTENDTNPEVHKFKQTQAVRFSGTITCPNPTPSSVFLSVFFVFSVVAFPRQRSNGDVAAITPPRSQLTCSLTPSKPDQK